MKRLVTYSLLLALLLSSESQYYIPELFGLGSGRRVQIGDYGLALIVSRWEDGRTFAFLAIERVENSSVTGRMTQIYGERIASYAPFVCSTDILFCYQRQNKENWRGAIEYRGHNRPMCGGTKIKDPCRLWRKDG